MVSKLSRGKRGTSRSSRRRFSTGHPHGAIGESLRHRSLICWLSAALLADKPTPRAVDENMPIAVIATVVITNFPVYPSGQLIVFFIGVGRGFVFGHEIWLRPYVGTKEGSVENEVRSPRLLECQTVEECSSSLRVSFQIL